MTSDSEETLNSEVIVKQMYAEQEIQNVREKIKETMTTAANHA